MRIVILETGASRFARRLSINDKIYKDYPDLEYEIREHFINDIQ